MADEAEVDVGQRKKGSKLKVILLMVAGALVVAIIVGLTLFLTGFFEKAPEQSVEELLETVEQEITSDATGALAAPSNLQRVLRRSPELERFEQTYLEMERSFLANVTNSRKIMQASIAIMTHYDERVFRNVLKHEFAIRSAVLDEMRQVTEAELEQIEFRVTLAEKIRLRMNEILEKYEDFGGIEQVHFTEFVIQ